MKELRKDLLLYGVTDRRWLQGNTLYEQVEEALQGGVTFIQLREKNRTKEEILQEAKALKALCGRYHVPLLINDDVEIALLSGADGVHVGQNDMEAGEARKKLGPDKIIGVSARTVEQAINAEKQGADYLGVGSVFSTGTKADAQKIDRQTLKEICAVVHIPVIAIGGINRDNVTSLSGTGICGVAVVSAIFAQRDIQEAVKDLKQLVKATVE